MSALEDHAVRLDFASRYELLEMVQTVLGQLATLAGFDEDSVKIYSGLVRPDAGAPVVADPAAPSAETPEIPEGARVEPLYLAEDVLAV